MICNIFSKEIVVQCPQLNDLYCLLSGIIYTSSSVELSVRSLQQNCLCSHFSEMICNLFSGMIYYCLHIEMICTIFEVEKYVLSPQWNYLYCLISRFVCTASLVE